MSPNLHLFPVTAGVQEWVQFCGELLTRLCLPQTLAKPQSRSGFTAPKLFGLSPRIVEERVLQHLSRLNYLPHKGWASLSVIHLWLLEKNNLCHWFCMHKPAPRAQLQSSQGRRIHFYICSTASCSSKKESLCSSFIKFGLVLIRRLSDTSFFGLLSFFPFNESKPTQFKEQMSMYVQLYWPFYSIIVTTNSYGFWACNFLYMVKMIWKKIYRKERLST